MVNTKGSKKSKYWAKLRFEVTYNPKRKQPYHWRMRSCNGRVLCSAELFTSERGPLKSINSIISAIKKGQYRIDLPEDVDA